MWSNDNLVTRDVPFFFTANFHGTGKLNGQAEKLLGRFMIEYAAANGGRRPYIGTKFATYPWRLTADSLVAACKASSERLQRPVDVGQVSFSSVLGLF
jgi:pyridoxine 4-dehydrogenase